ncbi:hypothetical protein [Mucilaginibacter sp. L196]|uniref:hypothetical protein n=1 Tax=Mucilaginibacter sp. L196 TaxID=1641870 RepID=UPI00131D45FB|nr:hypothetical protein [Mucilaginibacter sp. L196]
MKTLIQFISAFTLILCFGSCAIFKPQPPKIIAQIPVKPVFATIFSDFEAARKTISDLSGKNAPHTIEITEADVAFDNTVTFLNQDYLSLLIFKVGYSYTKKKDNTLTYSLMITPSSTIAGNLLDLAQRTSVDRQAKLVAKHKIAPGSTPPSDGIADMIVQAAKQFIDVYINNADDKVEKDLTVNIAFSVDQNGSVEFTGPIGEFTPDLSVSRDVQNTQTLTLKMVIDK